MSLMLFGCKTSEITPESGYKAGSAAGLAAAYVINFSNFDAIIKSTISSITTELARIVPTNTQTFAELWIPVIEKNINTYVEKQGMTSTQKKAVDLAFNVIVDALDHLFVKRPALKLNTDIAFSTINGFCTAFNSTLLSTRSNATKITYDVDSEMYMYLKSKFAK